MVTVLITCWIIMIVVRSVHNDLLTEFEEYSTCAGEPTGFVEFGADAMLKDKNCLISLEPRYCKYRCLLIAQGKINPRTLKGDVNEVRKLEYELPDFSRKPELIEMCIECMTDKIFTTENKCFSIRVLVYCIRNGFQKVCKSKDAVKKRWDVRDASSESDSPVPVATGVDPVDNVDASAVAELLA